jgi:hypothetical protein
MYVSDCQLVAIVTILQKVGTIGRMGLVDC